MGQNIDKGELSTSTTAKIAFFSALGNWLGDTILYPIDAISTRLKASKFQNHNPYTFLKKSIRSEGLKLFKGVQLAFPAAFVPTFVYVFVYDWGMRKVSSFLEKNNYHASMKLYFPFFLSSITQALCLILYLPVDTVRTRVQMNQPTYTYTSFWSALREIQRKEGFTRFYKSSRIYFICKTLQTAITFQSFQIIRYFAGPSIFWVLTNTILSTAIATTLLNPLEVLITRYALVDTTKKKLVFSSMVSKMYKREGIRGFYKGYLTELLHHCTYALFWLPIYQVLREKYGESVPE